MTIAIFLVFVLVVLALSFYLGSKTKSSSGYFAAGGSIHWAVNGIAFAGDYLSAASFLGICGLIATVGYDGFLYSIGYLAGWIVALFIVAEPMKRLGKFTFTDALDSKFNSRAIKLTAAISTLIVSLFYLIPQMVGAGVLVEPLLNMPHWAGVIMVGVIVIVIVATAGMASTTYVQFIKGAMLLVFSFVLVVAVLGRGLSTQPDHGGKTPFYQYRQLAVTDNDGQLVPADSAFVIEEELTQKDHRFVRTSGAAGEVWWAVKIENGKLQLHETQWVTSKADNATWINGAVASDENQLRQVGNLVAIEGQSGPEANTGPLNAFKFLSLLGKSDTTIKTWKSSNITSSTGEAVRIYYPVMRTGNRVMRPGLKFNVEGTLTQRLDFISLMLALFFGTAALPHILIRYYTVPSPACARKSTIVAIAAIGFFYILTMFLGLGAMVNSAVNPVTSNMSAPLLAQTFNNFLFAVISAIAFATVLGTVSGLIVAASGAVAHDILDRYAKVKFTEHSKVLAGKIAAFAVGIVAIILGIIFRGMNVSFLVGWAFAVAASANLPSIIMLLFWKKTTSQGIAASITVGILSALTLILLSPDMYTRYGLDPANALVPLSNPGIISIPLSFITLVVVSLLTQKGNSQLKEQTA